jgi:putative ABC transport system ATP-binding protein
MNHPASRHALEQATAGSAGPAAVAFEHVSVTTAAGPVLADVDARVPPRGITGIIGPSGAGKTTLLRLCNRLEVPTTGRVRYHGRDIADLDPLRLRRQVGMVFQRPALFAGTAADNLRVAAPHAAVPELAAALERVSLNPTLLDRPAATLSGGEAQRLCLARTLITGPDVLLADEPTAALDIAPRHAFERLARSLVNDGIVVLWVTHDLEQLRRIADEVIVLIAARVSYSGALDGLDQAGGAVAAFLAGAGGLDDAR